VGGSAVRFSLQLVLGDLQRLIDGLVEPRRFCLGRWSHLRIGAGRRAHVVVYADDAALKEDRQPRRRRETAVRHRPARLRGRGLLERGARLAEVEVVDEIVAAVAQGFSGRGGL
jgi:hypothetical protein